jgi:hypothetical protein
MVYVVGYMLSSGESKMRIEVPPSEFTVWL